MDASSPSTYESTYNKEIYTKIRATDRLWYEINISIFKSLKEGMIYSIKKQCRGPMTININTQCMSELEKTSS